MCYKNTVKVFYVLFRAVEKKPFSQIKSLDVFNQYPTSNEFARVMKNNVLDKDSIKVMKVEIPFSKLF